MIRFGCLMGWLCLALSLAGECIADEPPKDVQAAKAPPKVRRAFDLVRHDGARVTDQTFRGKPMLVFFGFVSCPDVCPTGLAAVSQATRRLDAHGIEVTPVFISIDPDRDTPELLRNYVKEFHPRMVALTGTSRKIAHAAAAFGVQYGIRKNAAAYYVWHSSSTYLVGPTGDLLETFPPYASTETIVNGARRLLGRKANGSAR